MSRYGARFLKENIYEEDFQKGWPKDDPLKTGYVYKAFEEGQLKKMERPEYLFYFVCGSPLHNISVMNLLDEYGVPREQIVLDDFGS